MKPAANLRAYLLRFSAAFLLLGPYPASARAGIIDPTLPSRLHFASSAKTPHLLPCPVSIPRLAAAAPVPRETASHEPHLLNMGLLPCPRSVPCLVMSSPSSFPLRGVSLHQGRQRISRQSAQGRPARKLPTIQLELRTLPAVSGCRAAESQQPESPVDMALTLGNGSRRLAQQSLEYADRRFAAAEANAPGADPGTYDAATEMLHAAWQAMQAHDYAAARAFSDKAARLATALDPE
jgi:hypothetical protein